MPPCCPARSSDAYGLVFSHSARYVRSGWNPSLLAVGRESGNLPSSGNSRARAFSSASVVPAGADECAPGGLNSTTGSARIDWWRARQGVLCAARGPPGGAESPTETRKDGSNAAVTQTCTPGGGQEWFMGDGGSAVGDGDGLGGLCRSADRVSSFRRRDE